MKLHNKNSQFSKSMKHFNIQSHLQLKIEDPIPIRTAMEQKIDLLRMPVYQKKKLVKKTLKVINPYPIQKTQPNKIYDNQKIKQNSEQKQIHKHYRYRSNHHKKTFHNGFRKTSGNLQQNKTKKNIIDIVVMQKQIEKQTAPIYQRTMSVMNCRQKVSKSLAVQDSQSLLRKNSLFLLNFIKRQQTKSKQVQQPHIGGIPNLASNMRISYAPVKQMRNNIPKTPKKCRTSARKTQKIPSIFSKFIGNMPIDPW